MERGGDRGALQPMDDGLAGRKKEEGGAALERERESVAAAKQRGRRMG